MFSRRDFIKQGLIPVFAGSAVPSVFANGLAAAAADAPNAAPSDRVLVLVQLAGGNDGLNTVIPFGDGAYHDARPTLRQDQGVLALNGQLGLHPNLKGMKASWDAGQLAIVQGVGYPSPNLSHFASMSIWETANVKSGIGDGWLGRYLNYLDKVGESPNHALEGVSAGSLVPPELRSSTPVTALQSLKTFWLQPVNERGRPRQRCPRQAGRRQAPTRPRRGAVGVHAGPPGARSGRSSAGHDLVRVRTAGQRERQRGHRSRHGRTDVSAGRAGQRRALRRAAEPQRPGQRQPEIHDRFPVGLCLRVAGIPQGTRQRAARRQLRSPTAAQGIEPPPCPPPQAGEGT